MQLNTVSKGKSKKQRVDFAMVQLDQTREDVLNFTDRITVNEYAGQKRVTIVIGGKYLFNGSKEDLIKILEKNQ
jgi:hypothetical protein